VHTLAYTIKTAHPNILNNVVSNDISSTDRDVKLVYQKE